MRRIFWVLALGGVMLSGNAWSQECTLAIEGNVIGHGRVR